MKELKTNEVTLVNGASYSTVLFALIPTIVGIERIYCTAVEGKTIFCSTLSSEPASIIPEATAVALFSAIFVVAVGYKLYPHNHI